MEVEMNENKIRGIENLHILLWIAKDTCWVNGWHWLGVAMIAPTMLVAIWLAIKTFRMAAEFTHNLAVIFWLCANSVWMIGEFFYDDKTRHIAMWFFGAGLGTLMIHYVPKWWRALK
jgi:hypothetical protein